MLASQLHGQGMVWQRAHTQAVDWKGAERGNNLDLAMTEGSDFPSSSAQANEASQRHSASTSGPDAQGALAPACLLPVHFFILRGAQVASFPLSSVSGFRLCLREEGPAGKWLLRCQRPQHKAVLL